MVIRLASLPGLDQQRARQVAEQAAKAAFVVKVFSVMTQVWGSGFKVPEGVVVTAKHVVSPALVKGTADLIPGTVIKVAPVEQQDFSVPAQLKEIAKDYDVAALEVSLDRPALPWGDFAALKEGDPVIVIGAPSTIEAGVTAYAGLGQIISLSTVTPAIFRYSVPVQPGSSGGPVLNMNGEIIGINLIQEQYEGGTIVGEGLRGDLVRKILHGEPVEWGDFTVMRTNWSWEELVVFGGSIALGLSLLKGIRG